MASKNWGLQVPTKTTPLTPLATPFALLASSISDALTSVLSGTARRGTTAQRDAFYGVPANSTAQLALQGARWYNTATNREQVYVAAFNATSNPAGFGSAGWYNSQGGAGDTGWQNFTVETTAGASSSNFQYRKVGTKVSVAGQVSYTGGFPNGYTRIGQFPEWLRPSIYTRQPIGMYNGYVGNIVVSDGNGIITIGASGDRSADAVYVNGTNWFTD